MYDGCPYYLQENGSSFVAQEELLKEREKSLAEHTSTVSCLQVMCPAFHTWRLSQSRLCRQVHAHLNQDSVRESDHVAQSF